LDFELALVAEGLGGLSQDTEIDKKSSHGGTDRIEENNLMFFFKMLLLEICSEI
jgi:hypothetical protein